VKITPAQPRDSNEEDIPEFDFDMFNFVFDVKIELPGKLWLLSCIYVQSIAYCSLGIPL